MSFLQQCIRNFVYKDNNNNLFNYFVQQCIDYHDRPAHSISELRQKNTKNIGDLFESFCVEYLKHCYKIQFVQVWLLKDVPLEILNYLRLKRQDMCQGSKVQDMCQGSKVQDMGKGSLISTFHLAPKVQDMGKGSLISTFHLAPKVQDMGIDIIAVDQNNNYYAVQAKFRKPPKYKTKYGLSWKELSTFYALANRTGPYIKHIVMTNSHYVRHVGQKTDKDVSICLGTFRNITKFQWLEMAGMEGQTLGGIATNSNLLANK